MMAILCMLVNRPITEVETPIETSATSSSEVGELPNGFLCCLGGV